MLHAFAAGGGDKNNFNMRIDLAGAGQALLNVDQYMALADFASYSHAQQKAEQLYKDQTKWNSMSLVNTAKAGIFAADRAIRDYANTIWLAKPVETKAETKKK